MSHEDILDDMSLSDDEMLDSLADDLLLEMDNEEVEDHEEIPTIEPMRAAPRASQMPGGMPMGFPFGAPGGPGGAGAGAMPDLSKMMQQMMPMMSQMFGGGGAAGGMPGMPGMHGGNASLQQAKLSWDELVKKHVPASEQDDWLSTIRADELKQRTDVANKLYEKPQSRSYHGSDAKPLPNVYMESETLLASLLNESVRARKAEHNATWKKYHGNLVSHLTQSGLAEVFTQELKDQLRKRVASDPDYSAARAQDTSGKRFRNIATALAV